MNVTPPNSAKSLPVTTPSTHDRSTTTTSNVIRRSRTNAVDATFTGYNHPHDTQPHYNYAASTTLTSPPRRRPVGSSVQQRSNAAVQLPPSTPSRNATTGTPTSTISASAAPTTATIRRLSDASVRAIFECIHNHKAPPADLPFVIVPVGPNGEKLSPPSFEFEDGLYVLLRPDKRTNSSGNGTKKKGGSQQSSLRGTTHHDSSPQAPEHLRHLLMHDMPPENCPWSLSGPQFPVPTAIQQRYCYPKGRPEYSNTKGGALWTMFDANGKEDKEYRLLHVYFSPKRATNKGGSGGTETTTGEELQGSSPHRTLYHCLSPPKKRIATDKNNRHSLIPPNVPYRRATTVSLPVVKQQPQQPRRRPVLSSPARGEQQQHHVVAAQYLHSPAITTSSTNSGISIPDSPLHHHSDIGGLPFTHVYSLSDTAIATNGAAFHHYDKTGEEIAESSGSSSTSAGGDASAAIPIWQEQLIVTPINDIHSPTLPRHSPMQSPARRQKLHQQRLYKQQRIYHGYSSDDSSNSQVGKGTTTTTTPSPSPFRRPIVSTPPTARSSTSINVQRSPLFRTGEYYTTATASLLHTDNDPNASTTLQQHGDNDDDDFLDDLDAASVSSSRLDPMSTDMLDFPPHYDMESFWNEPFQSVAFSTTDGRDVVFGTEQEKRENSFASRLQGLQENIRSHVLAAPETEQPKLVSLMASWARTVADDPLASVPASPSSVQQHHHHHYQQQQQFRHYHSSSSHHNRRPSTPQHSLSPLARLGYRIDTNDPIHYSFHDDDDDGDTKDTTTSMVPMTNDDDGHIVVDPSPPSIPEETKLTAV